MNWKRALIGAWVCLFAATAHADSLRTLGTAFFAAGAGMSFGGAVVGADASETYDQYLLTARQSDLAALHDDYSSKRLMSDRLSKAGAGLMAAGALFVIYSALSEDVPPLAAPAEGMSALLGYDAPFTQAGIVWQMRF